MSREKKITFNYYLNKRLKPIITDDKEVYQVYVRVIFDRNSTRFPVIRPGMNEEVFEQKFDLRTDHKFNEDLIKWEEKVRSIIKFEYGVNEERFKLKGIAKRMEAYEGGIIAMIEETLAKKFRAWLLLKIDKDKESQVFHQVLFFTDSYFIAKEFVGDEEFQHMPKTLKIFIKAFSQLLAFFSSLEKGNYESREEYEALEKKIYTSIIDWILGKNRKEFLFFLDNPPSSNALFKNKAPDKSTELKLWKEFQVFDVKSEFLIKAIDILATEAKG